MFWGGVISALLCLSVLVTSQGVATICPDEPVPVAGYCPAICNGGCERGVCEIRNPDHDVECPDEMPCRVLCEGVNFNGVSFSCSYVSVKCSKYASCDIFVLSNGGMGNFGVDCANTTHSCSIFCDERSSIFQSRCSNSTACSCASNCVEANSHCVPGVDCIGDVCFQKLPESCIYSVRGLKNMHGSVLPNGTCDCECDDPTLTKMSTPQGWMCGDPALICSSDAQCGFPIHGSCNGWGYFTCECHNPWTGPDCLTHGCPHCENGAFCGYTNPSECICVGHWTGENCTELLPVVPSRTDIPENVDRCNGSALVTWPSSPPASSSIVCPEPCETCSMDADGTPVCTIFLPLSGFSGVNLVCPDTHRCVIICNGACPGIIHCHGPFPCDLVCLYGSCSVAINCTSPSICRATCPEPEDSVSLSPMVDCAYPNGSCLCDTSRCPRVECNPGVTCNGDPCSAQQCPGGRQTLYNATDNTCYCECLPYLYENNGGCYRVGMTRDCQNCTDGGFCRDGVCWCKPGRSGSDCSVRDSCVALSVATTCPSACTFCEDGVCILLSEHNHYGPCPVGWPCVFICDGKGCQPPKQKLYCPAGSGPCEVWCWGEIPPQFNSYFRSSEFRPLSPCTNVSLVCDDAIGCRARCDQQFMSRSTSPYYQSRTIRSVQCGSNAPNATSTSPLDGCSSCGSDSCYIGSGDPCYTQSHTWSSFGYLPICPADKAGQWLIPQPDIASNTCGCGCAPGFQLVDGACSATGCDPICKNSGVCIASGTVGTPQRSYSCRCFAGWTGRDCTSRCFFPISANITSCYNGVYLISGELAVPTNQSVDLFTETPDMTQLIVDGSVVVTNSSTLFVGVPTNWTSGANATVVVAGNWTQQQNTTLRTTIVVNTTSNTLLTTSLTSNGTVSFKGGILKIDVNPNDVKNWLLSTGASNMTIEIFSYQQLLTEFDDVNIDSQSSLSSSCERIIAQPVYSSGNDGRGSLNVMFRLDTSACASISAGGIAAIVIVSSAVIAIILVFAFVPSVRAAIAPYFERSGIKQPPNRVELHEMDQETLGQLKPSPWQQGRKGGGASTTK